MGCAFSADASSDTALSGVPSSVAEVVSAVVSATSVLLAIASDAGRVVVNTFSSGEVGSAVRAIASGRLSSACAGSACADSDDSSAVASNEDSAILCGASAIEAGTSSVVCSVASGAVASDAACVVTVCSVSSETDSVPLSRVEERATGLIRTPSAFSAAPSASLEKFEPSSPSVGLPPPSGGEGSFDKIVAFFSLYSSSFLFFCFSRLFLLGSDASRSIASS